MANKLEASNGSSKFLPEDDPMYMVSVSHQSSDLSSPTLTSSFPITSGKNVIRSATDANGILHFLVKYDVTKDPSGRKRTKMRKCKLCMEAGKRRDVGQYCATCGESYSLCNKCDARDCFDEHIKRIKRITRQSKKNGNVP
jgi:hypothetical protein